MTATAGQILCPYASTGDNAGTYLAGQHFTHTGKSEADWLIPSLMMLITACLVRMNDSRTYF